MDIPFEPQADAERGEFWLRLYGLAAPAVTKAGENMPPSPNPASWFF